MLRSIHRMPEKQKIDLVEALPAMKYDFFGVVISISALYFSGRVWMYSFAALLVETMIVCVIYIVEYFIGGHNAANHHA